MRNLTLLTLLFLFQFVNPATPAESPIQAIFVPSPATHYGTRIDPETGLPVYPTILILHYTAASLGKTIAIFTSPTQVVSSHYTIAEDGTIYQHVNEADSAYHAGLSYWDGKDGLNRHSLGIEQVNEGYKERENQPDGIIVPGSDKQWYSFDERQIVAAIALCNDLIARYKIEPRNVVGHGDVAPKRKVDPGPLYPWETLAQYGVGAWPDFTKAEKLPCLGKAEQEETLEQWLIQHLHIWGYKLPDEGAAAKDIIAAFQMHFRQKDISGAPDQETIYILDALICNYLLTDNNKKCPCEYEK